MLTDQGMMEIGSLEPEIDVDEYVPVELTIHGIDGAESASHVYHGGESETLRFTTRFGYAIETTPEHP